jgi:hypothetical protein
MAHWDKETDIVWICPNDSKGKVIVISDLKIGLPIQPPKEDILFHDLPKKEQMWQREDIPHALKDIDTDEEYQDQPKEFRDLWDSWIEKQFERRTNGVWFYNNGQPTYLTGTHWFALQWVKQDFGYPLYLEPQAELEHHWAACVVDPRCYGQNLVKNRRFGWSTLAGSESIEASTRTKNVICGILSKTAKDAKDVVFQQKIVYPFFNLPFFFKPVTDGTTSPKSELTMRPPASKITKNQKKRQSGYGLNSSINWLATANNSYDGYKLFRLIHDESGKYEKPNNISKSWQVQKRCLEIRNKIFGKCRMGTTVNPMAKGGSEYKSLFYEGLLEGQGAEGRSENGRTKSGLYSIFIPAYRCIIYDIYGNSVIDDPDESFETIDGDIENIGGKTFLNRKRKSLKGDAEKYNEEIRQMPFNLQEAFMDTLGDCVFNSQNLVEQEDYNANLTYKPTVVGNFGWKGGVQDTRVVWNPDNSSGRCVITWMPKPELQSIITSEKRPPHDWLGVGGCDPYDFDQTADGRGSKGSLYLYNKSDPNGASNMFVLGYVKRPASAEMFYEDVLMAAVFYGYKILIENNKYGIARYFINRGYGKYLFNRPTQSLAPNTKVSQAERTKKGVYATPETIRAQDFLLEDYINNHVGLNKKTGEYGRLFFEELINQAKSYNVHNRTTHDAIVAAGHALYAAQINIKKPSEHINNKPMMRRFSLR